MDKQEKQQHEFVGEPIKDKQVSDVPGINDQFAEKLRENGVQYAYQLLGKFLMLQKDEETFKSWLRYKCGEGFGKNRRDLVCGCFKDWAAKNIK